MLVGLGEVWLNYPVKNLNVKKERISTNYWRIQAQILHFDGYKLMWINCYFPTDPQTVQFNDDELLAAQNEIENILDNNVFDDCIVGGDFNFDSRRNSGFSISMNNFLTRLGIVSVWTKFPADFTHLHIDSKSSSVIDHFFLNQRLLDLVEDAGPVHLGDNLSRHSPIMMKLRLPQVATSHYNQPGMKIPRRPAWYKASQDDKDQYTSLLEDKLARLEIPASIGCSDVTCQDKQHTHDRDQLVLDILCSAIETSYESIPMSNGARTGKKQHQPLPGWNQLVGPFKHDSLFWHSVWLSAGRPPSGSLYQVMCHARRKYHFAVKKVKRLASTAKAEQLLEASEEGDVALMKELKKSLDGKSTGQTVPESLEGKVTDESILEMFRDCFLQ